ncbi:cyclic peptide export ABC transporter [Archangium violaceum]|uniref:cyclic peptide export ABC transporter n=1 Tax=Archangium violaceum TaxID=83451 RepID=UPI00194DD258|nr:cyclic peptide export ABC transporter [Archangium violaceum]QRO01344.1 cyclic peptide export ABC transporter [Archangium violaceum]
MKLLALLMRESRVAVLLVVFFGLVSGAASGALLWLINGVLTHSTPPGFPVVPGFVACGLVALLARIASQFLLGRVQFGAVFALRARLCRQLLGIPLRHLEEMGTHRLTAMLVDDIRALSDCLGVLPFILVSLAIGAGCLVVLAGLSWPLFLVMSGFLAFGVLSYWLPSAWARKLLFHARDRQDSLFKHLRGLIEGIKELKLHPGRREAFLTECLEPSARDVKRLSTRSHQLYSASGSWGLFLYFAFIGLLLFVLPRFQELDSRVLVGYVLTILYLQEPLNLVLSNLRFLGQGNVALRKLQLLPELDPGAEPTAPLEPEPRGFTRLELVGVTHTYYREQEDTPFTLGPIHLTLRPGELVFLVGGNGSGKTTLAKLLTGLYLPEDGEILLDGVPVVTGAQRARYRQLFSTVFSDFYLFESLLGLARTRSREQVQGYLSRLQLDHKVRISEDGVLSTTALSQGQRKRLALLVAYLEDRPVYVFDEWAADQDPTFRNIFYRELLPDLKRKGKAVLVITHDDRYFPVADRLLHLMSGRLVQPVESSASAPA